MKVLEEINNLKLTTPNDAELGFKVRELLDNVESNKNNFIQCISCGRYQSVVNHNCKYCKKEL